MFAVKMKCPCCGTVEGPWWIDTIDGVLCVGCAGWVSGYYLALALYRGICDSFRTNRIPADKFWRLVNGLTSPWGPCPINGHSKEVN